MSEPTTAAAGRNDDVHPAEEIAASGIPGTPPPASSLTEDALPDRKRRLRPVAVAAVAASVVAVGGWTAFALAFSNASATAETLDAAQHTAEALESDLDTAKRELGQTRTQRDRLQEASDDVTAREKAVGVKETDLATREAALKAAEEYQKQTTLKDGFTYTVGLTMEPGTYRANSTNDRCYWVIYVSGSNQSDIVDNDLGSQGVITVTVRDGQDFSSKRCGDWTKVG